MATGDQAGSSESRKSKKTRRHPPVFTVAQPRVTASFVISPHGRVDELRFLPEAARVRVEARS